MEAVIFAGVLTIVLAILRVPLGFAFAIGTIIAVQMLDMPSISFGLDTFNVNAIFVLLAVPCFLLAGAVMERGRVSIVLIDLISSILRRLKGAMGYVTSIACLLFGAISGSAFATTAAIGSVVNGPMASQGYNRGYLSALFASSGILGILIPPSIPVIIYCLVVNASVARVFLACVFPGIMLCGLYLVVNFFYTRRMPIQRYVGGGGSVWKELASLSARALPALTLPVIILGGIYSGAMTPTEAAGVSSVVAILLGFLVYKGLNGKIFKKLVLGTAEFTASLFILYTFIMWLTRILTMYHVPQALAMFAAEHAANRIVALLGVNMVLLILGMFIDITPASIIAAPLLLPVVAQYGVSAVHFGAIQTLNLGIGLLTPPMAPGLYIAQRITKSSFTEMMKPLLVFLFAAAIPTLIVTTYVPAFAEFLPRLVMGR